MKVALIDQPIGTFTVPPASSIAIWTYQVARRLTRSCEVVIYGRRGYRQPKVERVEGVELRRISIGRDYRYIGRAFRFLERFSGFVKRPYASSLYYLDYILQVANDLRARHCDIVHIHSFSQFVPVIRALNPGVKIVLHMHCEWLTQLDRAWIERRLQQTDLILGCSEYITEKIRRRFPQFADRCQTIFNGVDAASFTGAGGPCLLKENGTKRLLFVGRLSPEKGLHVLLDAFRIVIEHHPHAQLEFVGSKKQLPLDYLLSLSDEDRVTSLASFYDDRSDFGYYAYLQRQARSLAVTDQVTFSDQRAHMQLINCYREADVYVQPSFSDAFPLPPLEAMATGIPVIGTRVGGIPEAVADGKTGLLVEPGDASALAEAILCLLADKDLRQAMGKAGQRRALDLFAWEQIAKNSLDQYKSIYEGHE